MQIVSQENDVLSDINNFVMHFDEETNFVLDKFKNLHFLMANHSLTDQK